MDDTTTGQIAIVGMGMRLPEDVRSATEFWQMLIDGRDGRCRIPKSRYNADGFYSESGAHSIRVQHGYFLREDLETIDTSFFDLEGLEHSLFDPQAKILLQVIWECLENGGLVESRGKDIGCFVGTFGGDYEEIVNKDAQNTSKFHLMGGKPFGLANFASYEFDWNGPSMTVETGCSSSLVALHQACQALNAGDCSAAVVAGTNLILTPTIALHTADTGVLSPSGICRTFDAAADGYGRGEAVNAVLIKRLDDAVRDGDQIRAVIRSTMVNCDGRSHGISTPSAVAQENLIRGAYHKASIHDVSQTPFVECHGTGTLAGDPIECAAMAKVFPKGTYIGSVKPNFGHSEGASGLTSLIKAILCLEHRQIPPNIHFNNPNPRIPWKEWGVRVPQRLIPWPEDREERISISNFGIGGSNAHAIIESFPSSRRTSPFHDKMEREPCDLLLVFSAKSQEALLLREESLFRYMESHPDRLEDLAYTLGAHREHLSHRGFLIKSISGDIPKAGVKRSIAGPPPVVTFVFTGQGAQWAGMGRELMSRFDSFRDDIRLLDGLLQGLERPPRWSLEDALVDPDTELINMPSRSQTLCCALQIALVNLLARWGVMPASVVGHSSGEIAAAYAAGAITGRCATALSYYRGLLVEDLGQLGAMAAVGLSRGEVATYLQNTVVIACENSPNSVTLSGEQRHIEAVLLNIKSDHPEALCRMLSVNRAYHSQLMAPVVKAYESSIWSYIEVRPVMVPMYSTLTGARIVNPQELDALYWCRNISFPVLFWSAIESIVLGDHSDNPRHFFLEIGPHSALKGPLRDIFSTSAGAGQELLYASCVVRGQNRESSLLQAVGDLFLSGFPINFAAINGHGKILTDLDPYPWGAGRVVRCGGRTTRDWRFRENSHHELLGSQGVDSTPIEPAWRNLLHLDDVPWLAEHQIGGTIVFPSAAYIVMAGEAIRQITGCERYRVRNLRMSKALILDDHETTEIVSNFRPVRSNGENLGSGWYEFSIVGLRRGAWSTHCTGQARAEPVSRSPRDITSFPRNVESKLWYGHLKENGLEYGPHFRRLQQISAHPIQTSATASLLIDGDEGAVDAPSAVDAPTIDHCLQLALVALCNGLARKHNAVGLPIFIRDIFVGKTGSRLLLQATETKTTAGTNSSSTIAQHGGEVAVAIDGLEFMALDESLDGDKDRKLCSHLVWAPDIDLLPRRHLLTTASSKEPLPSDTYSPEQQFFDMCIIETARLIGSLEPDSLHLGKYQRWVTTRSAAILGNDDPVVSAGIRPLLEVLREDWPRILDGLRREIGVASPLYDSLAELSLTILKSCVELVKGNCSPLTILMKEKALSRLYSVWSSSRTYEGFIKLLGHGRPDLHVLEIGAGTGATTAKVLECLHPPGSDPQYSRYLWTDISSDLLPSAEERFKHHRSVEFAVLDINQSPTAQGLDVESFDLVIASNVLHLTRSIEQTLGNIKSILKPGGRVLIEEICTEFLPIDYIMGILPGWWMGDNDDRVDVPYISVERWDEELRKAGFAGFDTVTEERDTHLTSIISSVAPSQHTEEGNVNILCHSKEHHFVTEFAQEMTAAGFIIRFCTIADPPPIGEDIISLLDVEDPFLYSITQDGYSQLQSYLSSCTSMRILWVTHPLQMVCEKPNYGLILGFARTMRVEYQMDFATVEVEAFDRDSHRSLIEVYRKFQQQRLRSPEEPLDYEYAIRGAVVYISRYRWSHLSQNLLEDATPDAPKTLTIEQPGILESLKWVEKSIPALGNDEVEIDVNYVGLNFRDLMIGLNMLPEKDGFGFEGSGLIRRVGASVSQLHPGDKVIFLHPSVLSNRIVVPEALVAPIPTGLSLEQAATVCCAYATAAYCLLNVGRLSKGQSVLIHSAAGGVGNASIMICQRIGVEIFATVGNQEKRDYLIQRFAIGADHIFDSRSTSFAPNLLERTQGRGVDLVLNSLAGDLLLASWDCVAEGGIMVEIGKRDFMSHAMLPMDRFLANRSFVGVDILSLARTRPMVKECLNCISELFSPNHIPPVEPMHTFAAGNVVEAFKKMQEGKHMGKIAIEMPKETSHLSVSKSRSPISFRGDMGYLLVGGLGGLGRAVAQWVVDNGARYLVFLSRSTRRGHDRFVHDLALQGCQALLVQGDIASLADAQRAVSASPKPIAGVFHLAMVIQRPKVEGTWNLHRALESSSLDFFVLFSSVAASVGSAGQANYTAANTFLETFARYRRSLGLQASVLEVGWLVDIGYVSQRPQLQEVMRSNGLLPVKESDLLDSLHLLLSPPQMVDGAPSPFQGQSQLSLGLGLSQTHKTSRSRYRDARYYRPPAVGFANSGPLLPENSNLRDLLSAVESNPDLLGLATTVDLLTKEIALRVGPYTLAVSNADLAAMAQISVDSLVAVEARTWLQRSLGVEIGLLDIATVGTVEGVVSLVMDSLNRKHRPESCS
ncbi:uncharacterized protein N7446_003115 [Penicillium canescens]|uniref:Uncharacterized protein n=1 Tax=Penicillium canescens TaxID=5083 RepID=A0AAD6NAF1_PENCN|nr:uncharacterized protein N7446_003115 [Penicillium canescens]KAJ6044919.1 hypothetical protein N7460_006274 [Penicillium canescens]KAJ6056388.1 hypothetical protein N7444_005486 [Penicillium canescens]KAJ6075338.1 hypothetical protein N7446_003115 [Penicillium canescens]